MLDLRTVIFCPKNIILSRDSVPLKTEIVRVRIPLTFSVCTVYVMGMYLYTDKNEKKIFLIYKEIPRDRVQSHENVVYIFISVL